MKLSTILPILTVIANERRKNENGENTIFVPADEVTEQCLEQIPRLGGIFETTNNGLSGEIKLDNYPNNASCYQYIQPDSRCERIIMSYPSFAIESNDDFCGTDYFTFRFLILIGIMEFSQVIFATVLATVVLTKISTLVSTHLINLWQGAGQYTPKN